MKKNKIFISRRGKSALSYNLLLKMRLVLFITFVFLGQMFASNVHSQSNMNLILRDVSLETALKEIQHKSEYFFVYNKESINLKRHVSVNLKNSDIKQVLSALFIDTDVHYRIIDQHIVLSKVIAAQESKKVVSGVVTDKNGQPLPGVSIVVKGTSMGVTTDADGKYKMIIPPNSKILVFSFIGMQKQEILVDETEEINVKMIEDAIGLEEVVAIGYGVKKKASLTGSVAQVDTKFIENRTVNKLSDALQGAVPGMIVQRSTGQPGDEGVTLKVRGVTSINSNGSTNVGPLILIDGVEGRLNDVTPQDIASFNVLKDGAASIYGSRAAGGVILVETKRGKKGRAKFNASFTQSYKKPTYIPRKASPFQYYTLFNEFKTETGQTPLYTEENTFQYLDDPNAHVLVQGNKASFWAERTGLTYRGPLEDIFWDTGKQNIYSINAGGGSDKLNYYVSGSLLDEEGILNYGPDDFKKINFRFNLDARLSEKLLLKTSLGGVYSKKEESPALGSAVNNFYSTYVNSPVWNENGDYYSPRRVLNPIQQLEEDGLKRTDQYKATGNVSLIYTIIKGLQFETKASLTANFYNTKINRNTFNMLGWNSQVMSVINNPNSRRRNFDQYVSSTVYSLLRYNRKVKDHEFGIMVGANQDEWDQDGFGAWRKTISVQEPFTLNTGNPDEQFNQDWGKQWAIRSYFGRVNYNYKNRYLAEFSYRRDGTSRFHPDYRWGNFCSVSMGWIMTEELWFPKQDWLKYAKLRLSYGESGNQNNIGLYDYISDLNLNNNPVVFGTDATIYPSASEGGMISLEREWETLSTYNLGVDLVLFKGLQTSFDVYEKYNDDLLLSSEYPSVLGAAAPKTNLGKLKTWGWDFSIGYQGEKGDFTYDIKLVLSDSQNELLEYGGKSVRKAGTGNIIEGYPVNAIFAYEYQGIMTTQEEADAMMEIENVPQNLGPGDIRIADLDGDGKYTPNGDPEIGSTGDLKYVGSPLPRYNFGLNARLGWKNFDISLFFQGVGKRTIYRNDAWTVPLKSTWMALPDYFYGQTWTEENPTGIYPSLDRRTQGWNWQSTSLRIENGAYIRLKNVEVGYNIPEKWVNKLGLERIRCFASGQDLWEYHKFDRGPDVDPEKGATFFYPITRGYSFGINVTF
ncbi:SusC/RagA family TonB-linked outer membrane protein [Prolixibacteraceae bacterium JC049]|nr:SusC/RagA family TonB-linked outer membrane protein [Prolixibacteraceae bacterium JC049]